MSTYTSEQPETIQAMFDDIAPTYDRCNAILSFQLHNVWLRTLIRKVLARQQPRVVLDLCAGTGDVAFRYLQKAQHATDATLLDFSGEMLERAQHKAVDLDIDKHTIHYVQGDAMDTKQPDNHFDAVTVAYGIRNVADPAQCCAEVYRVLKPGGTFAILELTRPPNATVRWGHQLYTTKVLPRIAGWVSSNRGAYEYLCSSIDKFMPPEAWEQMLKSTGYQDVWCQRLTFGIASLVVGKKPVS